MDRPTILIMLDTDPQSSVFDRVVAVDSGVDHLFCYAGIKPEQVQGLVHGAIFTRDSKELHRTALFIGGSDMTAGEQVMFAARRAMLPKFGLRVSMMLDSNGSNTTAAAAVRCAARHIDLSRTSALVLGGTGPVGQRVARLLAGQGAHVRIGSRQVERAEAVTHAIRQHVPNARVEAVATASSSDAPRALDGRELVIAAGAAGTLLLPLKVRTACKTLKVVIDLNAVPPVGIEGVEMGDKGATRDGVIAYGAIGVGGTKMKTHRRAIAALFERRDLELDAEQIFSIAQDI